MGRRLTRLRMTIKALLKTMSEANVIEESILDSIFYEMHLSCSHLGHEQRSLRHDTPLACLYRSHSFRVIIENIALLHDHDFPLRRG